MKAINVERDQQGMWVHPELPVWGENHSEARTEAWFASQGLTHHLILMEGELGERWGCGDLESCAEWQPETEVKDAFLVGIWDTEDGVVAMFASPSKESGDTLSQDLMDVIEDCGWEVEDALPLLAAIRVIEQAREPVSHSFMVIAGKYDGHERNCKYSAEFDTYDEAVEAYDKVSDYPWAYIECNGRVSELWRKGNHPLQ